MDLNLTGRVAIVTGASRGLGRAIASALAAEGTSVVAAARSADALDDLASSAPDRILAHPSDMQNIDGLGELVQAALNTFGRLDILVNNAGIAPAASFMDADLKLWERVLRVNLLAPVALTRAAGEVFLGQGSGKVINIASLSGFRGKPTLATYSASKGALVRFTEAIAGEWAPMGIQVNGIAPGAFATDAQRAVLDNPEILERRIRKIPAGRMGDCPEIGALACYLASPLSDFVSGATFVIDGGELHKL